MSTPPPGSVRHRGGKKKHVNAQVDDAKDTDSDIQSIPPRVLEPKKKSEWDYRIACLLITVAAFVTRFWGISHPNQVVFDEVHFGKVIANQSVLRNHD